MLTWVDSIFGSTKVEIEDDQELIQEILSESLTLEATPEQFGQRPNESLTLEEIKSELQYSENGVALTKEVLELEQENIALRRYFHENPELSLQEYNTCKFIKRYLEELGLQVHLCAKTGVVGILRGTNPNGPKRCILLRSDEDALSITETTNLPYQSKIPGRMHACGHDAHMSMLLVAAKVLSQQRAQLSGTIKFIFQPGEEGHGGAFKMIADNVLENPSVDEVYGCHVWSENYFGKGFTCMGSAMAGSERLYIEITGKGGHAGMPHNAKDAVVIASYLVIQLQSIVSRSVNPHDAAVITIGTIQGGSRANIISETCKLTGTIRTFNPELSSLIHERIEAICKGLAIAHNCTITPTYGEIVYPPTVNNSQECYETVKKAIQATLPQGYEEWKPINAAEDFSAFLLQKPGNFFFLGCAEPDNPSVKSHHKPNFTIDERVLCVGAQTWVNIAKDRVGGLPYCPIATTTLPKENEPNPNDFKNADVGVAVSIVESKINEI